MTTHIIRPARFAWAAAAALVCAGAAFGQAEQRAAFLANNGNLEGSVTSYLVNEDGSLDFVDKYITGEHDSGGFHYGTNAYSISITPDGSHLAIGHATGDPPPGWQPGRQITILAVNDDATVEEVFNFLTVDTPLDVQWLSDNHLAVTRTSLSLGSEIRVFEIDFDAGQETQIEQVDAGAFCAAIALHPSGDYLYAEATFDGNSIRTFAVNEDYTLTRLDTLDTGSTFPLGLNVAPNGQWLYAAGGISNGGDKVQGHAVDPDDGTLSPIAGSPFTSLGSSPRQVVISSDSDVAIAGHGSDGNAHTFTIDQSTGALSATPHMFDGGGQGNLQDMDVLDDLLLVPGQGFGSSNPQGLATLSIGSDGSLTLVNDYVDSQGISPNAVVGWSPEAPTSPADLTGDGTVGGADLGILLSEWGECADPDDCPADLNGDGTVGGADLGILLSEWTSN